MRRVKARDYARRRDYYRSQQNDHYARKKGPAPSCALCGASMKRNSEFGICKMNGRCVRVQSCLQHGRRRALAKGLAFSITAQDVLPVPTLCPILGIPLSAEASGVITDASPTLDRIDNEKGYVPGNVQWVSYQANRMKSNADLATLRQFAEWALRFCDAQRMPDPHANIN